MNAVLLIGNVDRTADWRAKASSVDSAINNQIDTAQIVIEGSEPAKWQEIILRNSADTVRYFAGYIINRTPFLEGIDKGWSLDCSDYSVRFDRTIVNEVYEDMYDDEILEDILQKRLPEFYAAGVGYITRNTHYDRIVFNRQTLMEIMGRLAEQANMDWYVDYFKRLHFYTFSTEPAPFSLSDNPNMSTSYPYHMDEYTKNGAAIYNRVAVVGGTAQSDDCDIERPGDGQTTQHILPYQMRAAAGETGIIVYKNTGSDVSPVWTAITIGIAYIHEIADYDCLYNYAEKALQFAVAPPNLLRSFKVHGRYNFPLVVNVTDKDCYEDVGFWLDAVIDDNQIEDPAVAQLIGTAFLQSNADEKEQGSLTTWTDGLQVGQQLTIVHAAFGITGGYVINKLSTAFLGNGQAQYSVEFGDWDPDLIQTLVALKRKIMAKPRDDTEIIREILSAVSETLTLAEATSLTATGPIYYCYDTSGADQIKAGQWRTS